jgi:peptidoglycan/xylan/chitin deacetylase (PgdA/CDA1 family)
MKTAIVIIVVILMIVPMIVCIMLSWQVNRLQKQVEQLISIHSQYELADLSGESSYAYAAEKEDLNVTPTMLPDSEVDALKELETVDSNVEKSGLQSKVKSNDPSNESSEEKSDQDTNDRKEKEIDGSSNGKYKDKIVYLTFDDGPSIYTDDILDILKEYEVKATFFVVGKTDAYSKEMYQRIVEEGHTLGMHSYSHQYSTIYNSVEDFEKDFTKLWKLLYDTTGYQPSIFRFPGGSDNMVNKHGMDDFIRYLNENGIVYFDWNVLNGDATGVEYTKEQLIDHVLDDVDWKDNSIVLMHDSQTKGTTVDSLPGLLKILKSEGAQILPIDKNVTPIQMIKADTIK